MDWVERLNRAPGRVALGGGAGAEVLHWAYQAHLADNVPHRHAYFEVCRVGEWGAGRYVVEGTPHDLRPGDLFFARPGVVHQIVNTATPLMELYWVSFLWERGAGESPIGGLLSRFAEAAEIRVVPDTENRVGGIWRSLRAVASAPDDGDSQDAQLAALMTALLLGIARAGAGPGEPLPESPPAADAGASLARIAVRYVHDNLSRPLTVPEVAAYLHLSPRHLTRLFARFTGVSPAAYIEQARMERARSLLLRTDDPIKQVASLVGYGDVHHFTRVFSRRFGCPPGRFRETQGAADRTPRGTNIQKPGALV
jgi:AraC-like DNA-binding protein/mannose-6-phosphate isomerase-like protein (cupin superfamily)